MDPEFIASLRDFRTKLDLQRTAHETAIATLLAQLEVGNTRLAKLRLELTALNKMDEQIDKAIAEATG